MSKPVLVIGGGIAGIQASLDLAEHGVEVYLVEKNPSIGGKMAQLDKTFPTLDCASCILTPKMAALLRYSNVKLLTYSEVQEVKGKIGDFTVRILKKPRYVDWNKCTGCGTCIERCPVKVSDLYNANLSQRKAIYIEYPQAVPRKALIDSTQCLRLNPPPDLKEKAKGKPLCGACEKVCPTKAIDYNQQSEIIEINVAAIIVATGLDLYDARNIPEYGYGKYQNVYTHLEFERLVSSTGPTNGELIRRSDGKHPKKIAWIQCVGSRDIRFNHYCSAFCCMAATKQAILAKEHIPDVDTTIYFMDMRAFGKGFYEFFKRAMTEYGVKYVRGKVVKIIENPHNKNLILFYEDTLHSYMKKEEFDMVVLSVAVRPNKISSIPLKTDKGGFIQLMDPYLDTVSTSMEGIFVIGGAAEARDIPDSVTMASSAAIKASTIAKRHMIEKIITIKGDKS
ncbi:MAG: CoB--CoM heterodisulfide reductase iron-sulfur subunit A family protein [Nitrososphaerota archaeon]